MLKRVLCTFTALAFMVALVAGCGTQTTKETTQTVAESTSAASSSDTATPRDIKLSFLHSKTEDPANVKYFEQAIQAYTKEHPNVTIDIGKVAFSDLMKAAITALNTGTPYDIIFGPTANMEVINSNKLAIPLNKYFDADNGEWRTYYKDGVMEAVTYADGNIYIAPVIMNSLPMNYHKDILEKYNVQPPANKAELYALCERLKNDGLVPWEFHGSMTDEMLTILSGQFAAKYNIKIEDVSMGKVPFTDPYFKDTLSILKEMYDKGYFPKNFWSLGGTEGRMLYSQGQMVLKMGYFEDVDTHYSMGMPYENQGVATMPNLTGDDSLKLYKFMQVEGYIISPTCKEPDQAADFSKFMAGKDNQDDMSFKYFGKQPNGWPVTHKDIDLSDYANAYVSEISTGIPMYTTGIQTIMEKADVITVEIPLLMQGKRTVDEVAAAFEKVRTSN